MERLTERQEELIADAPESMRGIIRDALQGVCSRSRAIKAHCLICCNFDRKEVRNCTVITCALNAYRPYIKRNDSQTNESQDDGE